MNVLAAATQTLWAALQGAATQVLYTRPGVGSVELSAVRGRSEHEEYTGEDAPIIAQTDDWIVALTDLKIDGTAISPQVRDTITITGSTEVYTVQRVGNDKTWHPVGQTQQLIRIHTKRTA